MSYMPALPEGAAVGPVESLGARLRGSFPMLRVHLCSLHDDHGDVLWLSEGFLGPDEHSAILHAYECFGARDAPNVVVVDLGDGRCAAVLAAQTAAGTFGGATMLIVDARSVRGDDEFAQFRTPPVVDLLREFALLCAPAAPAAVPPPAAAEPHGESAAAPPVDTSATAIGRRINLPIPATQVAPEIDRWFADLRQAEIALHVQRLVPLQPDDGIRRFEVLLRSGTETDRSAAPLAMLTRATKAGLASMIDRRVITTLLAWVVSRRGVWERDRTTFSVNLSATALRDEHFGRFLELCITKAKLPAGTIGFEVGEQACLGNAAGLGSLAALLGQIGCPLAIDDFTGSGRGLELLRTRGVHMLKFSEAVTTQIDRDELKRAKLASFVHLARVLGMHTVAKRVNEPAGHQALRALGVGFVQSFSAAAPCTLESLLVDPAPSP
jgi:EAL domain-containing protein (putative c-di-GMP-specific phosphodiesterase class I)